MRPLKNLQARARLPSPRACGPARRPHLAVPSDPPSPRSPLSVCSHEGPGDLSVQRHAARRRLPHAQARAAGTPCPAGRPRLAQPGRAPQRGAAEAASPGCPRPTPLSPFPSLTRSPHFCSLSPARRPRSWRRAPTAAPCGSCAWTGTSPLSRCPCCSSASTCRRAGGRPLALAAGRRGAGAGAGAVSGRLPACLPAGGCLRRCLPGPEPVLTRQHQRPSPAPHHPRAARCSRWRGRTEWRIPTTKQRRRQRRWRRRCWRTPGWRCAGGPSLGLGSPAAEGCRPLERSCCSPQLGSACRAR